MEATKRTFEDTLAVRSKVPLFVGLVGPSGTGKTYSALRLATGVQRVVGGDIWVIDTESNRSKHYAGDFRFRHVPFAAPFSPLDYLAAIEHCIKKGARNIIIDSFSHEHEGPGGVLEWHSREMEELAAKWKCSTDKTQMPAWAKPKEARRRLINTLLQVDVNAIFCFRAKPKLEIIPGKQPKKRGLIPIGGEEFIYEFVIKFLLKPGADGKPTFLSDFEEERNMIKIPKQFRGIFNAQDARQLSEDDGHAMAEWAAGEGVSRHEDLIAKYAECKDDATFKTLEAERKKAWSGANAGDKLMLKSASDKAAQRILDSMPAPASDDERAAIEAAG